MRVNRLRTVLLERISRLGPDSFQKRDRVPFGTKGPWITMGHFDAMYVYPLDIGKGGMFRAMQANVDRIASSSDGQTYFHPLYLVPQEDDTEFWDSSSWNMGVLRVHLADTSDLIKDCKQLKEDLRNYAYNKGCDYQIYYTVELSDLVIVVKADQLLDLLRFSLNLRQFLYIGKVYSYFGVDYKKLCNFQYEGRDEIPLCSMRFAVSDAREIGKLLEIFKEKMKPCPDYSITGVDDVCLFWTELPTKDIYSLYYALFSPEMPKFCLGDAVSDITTRVGIKNFPKEFPDDAPIRNEEFKNVCGELVEQNGRLQKLFENQNCDWLRPLSELSNTLAYMGGNAVMDSFLFLMLPAVQSFFLNLEKASVPLSQRIMKKCHDFVRRWNHLMELITRTEGQLSHYPELRPLVFDIPVIMLEYTLSFLDRCAEILQREDEAKQEIQFLLVPQLCQRIEEEELFPAERSMPGLILVELPYSALYDTSSSQAALCHELSHFVGEKYRNRAKRVDYFTKAVAILACKVIFRCYDQALADMIQGELKNAISAGGSWMIVDMVDMAENWINRLLLDEDTYTQFSERVFTMGTTSAIYLPARRSLLAPYRDNYTQLVWELGGTFREVFADVCMLYLLRLAPERYIEMFDAELAGGEEHRQELFYLRIYVCLRACGGKLPNRKELLNLQEQMKQDMEPENRVIPLSVIKQLEDYARTCYESFGCEESYDLIELRTSFQNVSSSNMDYDLLQKDIERYRKRMFAKWCEATST